MNRFQMPLIHLNETKIKRKSIYEENCLQKPKGTLHQVLIACLLLDFPDKMSQNPIEKQLHYWVIQKITWLQQDEVNWHNVLNYWVMTSLTRWRDIPSSWALSCKVSFFSTSPTTFVQNCKGKSLQSLTN